MKALIWIYRRIGQMLSFALGGFFAFLTLFGMLPAAIMAVGFFGLALYLRHQMLNAEPERDTLTEWWSSLSSARQDAITKVFEDIK